MKSSLLLVLLGCCATASLLAVAQAQNLELPKLPYEYEDLEPAIDRATMFSLSFCTIRNTISAAHPRRTC